MADVTRKPDGEAHDCAACPADLSRRAFLRDAAAAAAASLMMLGLSAEQAWARPIGLAWPIGATADTVTYSVPQDDGATIDRDHRVILVRWQQKIYALSLTCPHQNTALRWLEADKRFQCPKHESKYQPDGTFISGRATRGMDRYELKRDGDNIIVDLGALKKETEDKSGWTAAVISL